MQPWMMVDAASLAIVVITRTHAMSSIARTTTKLEAFQAAPLNVSPDANSVEVSRVQLERDMLMAAETMVQYEKLTCSKAFQILDVLPIFDFVWQVGGIALLFDTPSKFCASAQLLLGWARVRGLIFLVGLVPVIINLAMVVVKAAAKSRSSSASVLSTTDSLDKALFPYGPPVITILARSFFVRDVTDMQALELKVMAFEKRMAKQEKDRLNAEYEEARIKAAELEETFAEQAEACRRSSQEDMFMHEYGEAVTKLCASIAFAGDTAATVGDTAAAVGDAAGQAADSVAAAPTGEGEEEEDLDGGTGSSMLGAVGGGAASGQ